MSSQVKAVGSQHLDEKAPASVGGQIWGSNRRVCCGHWWGSLRVLILRRPLTGRWHSPCF